MQPPYKGKEVRIADTGLIVGGQAVTVRQLEHIGDGYVTFLARVVLAHLCDYQAEYFHWTGILVRNSNLATAVWPDGKTRDGSQAEIEFGRIVLERGINAAFEPILAILKTTDAWLRFERHMISLRIAT